MAARANNYCRCKVWALDFSACSVFFFFYICRVIAYGVFVCAVPLYGFTAVLVYYDVWEGG